MKILPAAFAAASLLLATACATVGTASSGAGASPSAGAGTHYCWKDKLATSDGRLACNWGESAAEACKSEFVTDIPQARVAAGPRSAGRCSNGQWLVEVTTR